MSLIDVRNLSTGEVHTHVSTDHEMCLISSYFLSKGKAMDIHDEQAVAQARSSIRRGKRTAAIEDWCVMIPTQDKPLKLR